MDAVRVQKVEPSTAKTHEEDSITWPETSLSDCRFPTDPDDLDGYVNPLATAQPRPKSNP